MSVKSTIISLPKEINYKTLNELLNENNIKKCFKLNGEKETIIFDFQACEVISPTAIVFIKMLRDLISSQGHITMYRKSNDKKLHTFIQKMKLVLPNQNYIDTKEISDVYTYPLHLCNDIKESENAHIEIIKTLKTTFENMEKSTAAAIDYMLTEIRDNAGVHGYEAYTSKDYKLPVYICCCENTNNIELTVGDLGQGVYQSMFKNNTGVKDLKPKEVIIECFKNKVSGHPDSSPGFGLYSSTTLLKNGGGELHMWTSNSYIKYQSGKEKIYSSEFPVGTIVTFIIDKSAILPFDELFAEHGFNKNSQTHIDDFMEGIFDE